MKTLVRPFSSYTKAKCRLCSYSQQWERRVAPFPPLLWYYGPSRTITVNYWTQKYRHDIYQALQSTTPDVHSITAVKFPRTAIRGAQDVPEWRRPNDKTMGSNRIQFEPLLLCSLYGAPSTCSGCGGCAHYAIAISVFFGLIAHLRMNTTNDDILHGYWTRSERKQETFAAIMIFVRVSEMVRIRTKFAILFS